MRAIVVVLVGTFEAKMLAREVGELTISRFEGSGDSGVRETTDFEEPPFWTWFIENPRGFRLT